MRKNPDVCGHGEPYPGIAYERMARDGGASEFSWGAGLDCPGFENKPPSEGGRYKGQPPPCEPNVGVRNR